MVGLSVMGSAEHELEKPVASRQQPHGAHQSPGWGGVGWGQWHQLSLVTSEGSAMLLPLPQPQTQPSLVLLLVREALSRPQTPSLNGGLKRGQDPHPPTPDLVPSHFLFLPCARKTGGSDRMGVCGEVRGEQGH